MPMWLSSRLIALLCSVCTALPLLASEKADLEQLQKQINQISGKLGSERKDRDELQELLSRTEKHISQLSASLRDLQQQQAVLDSRLNSLQQQQDSQQQGLVRQRHELHHLLVSAYANGRQEKLKLFLNQQDPALLNRMMTYYRFLNEQRLTRINEIEQLLDGLEKTRLEIEQTRVELESSVSRQTLELEQLQAARHARGQLVAELNQSISSKEQALERLVQDRKALTSVIENIEKQEKARQQQKQVSIGSLKGRLPWPTSGNITRSFGQSKAGDVSWDGVLISSPEGQEVKAIHYGRVAYADWLRGYGLLTIIDHGNGIMTLYGHNQSLLKEVGEWVDKLEPVALTGNSGGNLESGLYFSIRRDGKPSNPRHWCRKTTGGRVSDQPAG